MIKYGNTALHWASKDCCLKKVKILVQSQASLNVKNKETWLGQDSGTV